MVLYQTAKVPAHPCWKCQKENDNATGTRGRGPIEGDFSMCFYCGALGRYDANLRIQPLTPADQQYLRTHPNEQKAIERARFARELIHRTYGSTAH